MGRILVAAVTVLTVLGVIALSTLDSPRIQKVVTRATSATRARSATTTTTPAPATTAATAPAPSTVAPTTTPATPPPTTAPPPTAAPAEVHAALAGCPPPPPKTPVGTPPPPWHPATLVPDSQLPPVTAPATWSSNLTAIQGTGMWIWQWSKTAGGNAAAIVAQAQSEHLHQLWVRVGDSMNGFYGADELQQLVPVAHAAGLSVIAWGFPYLYDPVGDARWTAQILDWRSTAPGAAGQAVDGYSADIERASEGVALSGKRAAVYLEDVRKAAGNRPMIATVYPPTDDYWLHGGYPFSAMAPYVDAFAPMIYWECTDPGTDVAADVARLATLRPVTVIGQAFDMADVGGRTVAPSAAEIQEFLTAGKKAGAVGATLWVWQDATAEEWSALGAYRW